MSNLDAGDFLSIATLILAVTVVFGAYKLSKDVK